MASVEESSAPTEPRLVSICLPSYNYARFLPDAVASVLEQSYDAFELLIVDNGSTDGSYEIALDHAKRDERITVMTHERHVNRGVNASLNLGLAQARGSYFCLLPADDVLLPDSLGRRVALLDAHPDAGFVYGTAEILDKAGSPVGRIGGRAPDEMRRFDATGDILQAILFHDFVPGAAILARRELLTAIGGFDEAVYFNDWYVTVRLLARATCAFVTGQPVVGYRLHERHAAEDNLAADRPRKLELFRALRVHAAAAGDRLAEPRVRALIALQLAVHASRLEQEEEASAAVRDALAADPSLGEDADYISWWLDPCHNEWTPAISDRGCKEFVAALGNPARQVDDVLAVGSDYTRFVCGVLRAAGDSLGSETRSRVAWTIVALQLETLGAAPRPGLLLSLLLRASIRPRLLSVRAFVKTVLCAAGVWPLAAKARRRTSAIAR